MQVSAAGLRSIVGVMSLFADMSIASVIVMQRFARKVKRRG